jgi:hypothetical protein
MTTLKARRSDEKTLNQAQTRRESNLKTGFRAYSVDSEILCLGGRRSRAGSAYEKAVHGFAREIKKFRHLLDAEHIRRDSVLEGRAAAYHALGIKVDQFYGKELLDNKHMFDLIVHGRLRENILSMVESQVTGQEIIEIQPVRASSANIYCATVKTDGREEKVFVNDVSVRPELFAVELLDLADVLVPEIRNVAYGVPGIERELEYGVLKHIANSKNIRRAASLRAFARDEHLAGLVEDNFSEFCQELGYVFEVCRKFGIQDRHSRNVYVVEKQDGSLGLGLIDLDIVGCYPTQEENYILSYAHDLHFIAKSIDFASVYGEDVRSGSVDALEERVNNDQEAEGRRQAIFEGMLREFMRGAHKAHMLFENKEIQEKTERLFETQDGLPVGIGQVSKKREKTGHSVNGKVQELIQSGPDTGRFNFSRRDAWDLGFLRHLKNSVEEFWKKTFAHAPKWQIRLLTY